MSLADDVLEGAPGTVSEFAGINLPSGYLWANGQAVSRSTYARLFAALTMSVTGTVASGSASISSVSQDLTQLPTSLVGAPISGAGIPAGTTILAITSSTITLSQNATAAGSGVALCVAPHGVGDGSTTFNVPDRRGRAGVGHDLMGAASAAGRLTAGGGGITGTLLGAAGGAETHVLSTAEIPAHTHANTITDPGHTHANTLSDPGHTHSVNGGVYGSSSIAYQYYQGGSQGGPYAAIGINAATTGVTLTNASHTAGVTITNASIGSGNAHTITQPSIVMNFIIKT
jgi:microcystin-dependent protein